MRRAPKPGEGQNGGVPIVMPKGSAVFFTHGVWHWQGDRTEPGDRITLHMHYNRGIRRSLEPKKVDPQMLHRNSPRLGEMLGEDDWFDKMDGIGRDHTRFAHMLKLHAFTEQQKKAILASIWLAGAMATPISYTAISLTNWKVSKHISGNPIVSMNHFCQP